MKNLKTNCIYPTNMSLFSSKGRGRQMNNKNHMLCNFLFNKVIYTLTS